MVVGHTDALAHIGQLCSGSCHCTLGVIYRPRLVLGRDLHDLEFIVDAPRT